MVPKKEITVRFNANVIDRLPWSFVPSQNEVEVVPGETVLAFYKAENKSEKPIIGESISLVGSGPEPPKKFGPTKDRVFG